MKNSFKVVKLFSPEAVYVICLLQLFCSPYEHVPISNNLSFNLLLHQAFTKSEVIAFSFHNFIQPKRLTWLVKYSENPK